MTGWSKSLALSAVFLAHSEKRPRSGGSIHDRRGRSAFNGCRYLPGSEQREGGQERRDRQKIFLGEASEVVPMEESPIGSALVVGAAYIAGAIVPVLPVLIGATNAVFSVITAGLMVVLVSTVLSFLSGMDMKRRILLNLVMIAIAVSVTYGIGVFAKTLGHCPVASPPCSGRLGATGGMMYGEGARRAFRLFV